MEDAINQLQDLGVTREQAKKALARYNNDIARAADYIFSKNYVSDDELEEITTNVNNYSMDYSKEEADTKISEFTPSTRRNNSFTSIESTPMTPMNSNGMSEPAQWSVVPYTPKVPTSATVVEPSMTNKQYIEHSSLTWWRDPEDPSERTALIDIPVGLRPPSYNFAYSPILILSMYHVSAFRKAVLSYRPTAASWGSPNNYWKGFGDKITDSMFKADTSDTTINELIPLEEVIDQQISDHLSIDDRQPKSVHVMAELQKLFAYLGLTKRSYGNVSHYVRALNTKLSSTGWESMDKTFEVFLEMMINSLVESDEFKEDKSIISTLFRELFLLRARIEWEDDYEEEVYHLTLCTDSNMNSFHACLDPLVYETQLVDEYNTEEGKFKYTSFNIVPPIMMIMLDNKSGYNNTHYNTDTVIYMDRYMSENKVKSIQRFKEMEYCRREIELAKLKIRSITDNQRPFKDKRHLLNEASLYFAKNPMKEVGLLESVLSSIRQRMDEEIDELERKIIHYQELISTLFDTEDMKKIPYRLRASFHHDGKSGTGHYWAYIWVEPSEENKLHEVSPDSGWFKFCDALVIPVSEDELFNDPVPPFALMYVDQYLPFFNMNSVQESIPEALKKFVQDDNEALLQEIKNYEQLQESGYGMMLTTPEDSMDYDDKTGDNNQSHYGDIESSSLTFDDNTSTGTVVGQNINEYPQYSFTGNGFFKLKERVDAKMKEVSGYSADDYRFIRKFENFLAISRNKSILEHLYLFYSSEEADKDPIDTDIYVDELASKENEEFSVAWREYNIYLGIAETVTRALFNFSEKKYQAALQLLLKAKQEEAAWKTRIIIDADLFSTYSGLDALSFNNIILVYGKECLEILNQAAFVKACNAAYRTRGLEEAIRIAYQAQSINAPDHIDQNETLRKPWLNFTDQPGVDSLQPVQETLLNTLVMIYIEGQTDASADDTLITEEDTSQFDSLKDMVLWNKYRYICSQCQYMLSSHT